MECKEHWKNNNRDVLNQHGWLNEEPSEYHVEGQVESHREANVLKVLKGKVLKAESKSPV